MTLGFVAVAVDEASPVLKRLQGNYQQLSSQVQTTAEQVERQHVSMKESMQRIGETGNLLKQGVLGLASFEMAKKSFETAKGFVENLIDSGRGVEDAFMQISQSFANTGKGTLEVAYRTGMVIEGLEHLAEATPLTTGSVISLASGLATLGADIEKTYGKLKDLASPNLLPRISKEFLNVDYTSTMAIADLGASFGKVGAKFDSFSMGMQSFIMSGGRNLHALMYQMPRAAVVEMVKSLDPTKAEHTADEVLGAVVKYMKKTGKIGAAAVASSSYEGLMAGLKELPERFFEKLVGQASASESIKQIEEELSKITDPSQRKELEKQLEFWKEQEGVFGPLREALTMVYETLSGVLKDKEFIKAWRDVLIPLFKEISEIIKTKVIPWFKAFIEYLKENPDRIKWTIYKVIILGIAGALLTAVSAIGIFINVVGGAVGSLGNMATWVGINVFGLKNLQREMVATAAAGAAMNAAVPGGGPQILMGSKYGPANKAVGTFEKELAGNVVGTAAGEGVMQTGKAATKAGRFGRLLGGLKNFGGALGRIPAGSFRGVAGLAGRAGLVAAGGAASTAAMVTMPVTLAVGGGMMAYKQNLWGLFTETDKATGGSEGFFIRFGKGVVKVLKAVADWFKWIGNSIKYFFTMIKVFFQVLTTGTFNLEDAMFMEEFSGNNNTLFGIINSFREGGIFAGLWKFMRWLDEVMVKFDKLQKLLSEGMLPLGMMGAGIGGLIGFLVFGPLGMVIGMAIGALVGVITAFIVNMAKKWPEIKKAAGEFWDTLTKGMGPMEKLGMIIGAIAGGLLGLAFGPLGVIIGILGGGAIGAGLGKAVDYGLRKLKEFGAYFTDILWPTINIWGLQFKKVFIDVFEEIKRAMRLFMGDIMFKSAELFSNIPEVIRNRVGLDNATLDKWKKDADAMYKSAGMVETAPGVYNYSETPAQKSAREQIERLQGDLERAKEESRKADEAAGKQEIQVGFNLQGGEGPFYEWMEGMLRDGFNKAETGDRLVVKEAYT